MCTIIGSFMMEPNNFFDFRLLPWNIEVAFSAIIFYALGNLLMRHFSHSELVSLVVGSKRILPVLTVFLSCLIVLFCGAMFNRYVSMGSTNLGRNPLVFYLTAICGIVVFICLCIRISIINKSKISFCLLRYIKWFGLNSFDAMAIHNPIKGFVIVVVASISYVTTSVVSSEYLYSLIVFVITLFVTSLFMFLINRIKTSFYNK